MDWFSLGLDAFGLAAQAALHLAFLCRLTGKRGRAWHFALYLALLVCAQRLCAAAGWGTAPALALMLSALYAVSRLALKNRPAQTCTAALLAVLASLALCGACCALVLRLLPPEDCGSYPGLLTLPGLFFLAAELYIMETAYSRVSVSPEPLGRHVALLALQVLGLAALLCTLYAYRRACVGAEEPFLRVRGQRQGDFYRLEFENSCAPGPPPEPGTGLRNIRAAAEKYGGAAAWEKTGGRFRLDVLLNIWGQRSGSSRQSS